MITTTSPTGTTSPASRTSRTRPATPGTGRKPGRMITDGRSGHGRRTAQRQIIRMQKSHSPAKRPRNSNRVPAHTRRDRTTVRRHHRDQTRHRQTIMDRKDRRLTRLTQQSLPRRRNPPAITGLTRRNREPDAPVRSMPPTPAPRTSRTEVPIMDARRRPATTSVPREHNVRINRPRRPLGRNTERQRHRSMAQQGTAWIRATPNPHGMIEKVMPVHKVRQRITVRPVRST